MEKTLTVRGRKENTLALTFTPEDRAKVGKYAAQNEIAKTQKNFRKLNLSENTVH